MNKDVIGYQQQEPVYRLSYRQMTQQRNLAGADDNNVDDKPKPEEQSKPEEQPKPESPQEEKPKEEQQPATISRDDMSLMIAAAIKKHDEDKETERNRQEQEKAGDFQKLYEGERKKALELSSKAERADKLEEVVNKVIDNQIKAWPASVKKSDPGNTDALSRLQWMEGHSELAKDLMDKNVRSAEHGAGSGVGSRTGRDPVAAYVSNKDKYYVPGQK